MSTDITGLKRKFSADDNETPKEHNSTTLTISVDQHLVHSLKSLVHIPVDTNFFNETILSIFTLSAGPRGESDDDKAVRYLLTKIEAYGANQARLQRAEVIARKRIREENTIKIGHQLHTLEELGEAMVLLVKAARDQNEDLNRNTQLSQLIEWVPRKLLNRVVSQVTSGQSAHSENHTVQKQPEEQGPKDTAPGKPGKDQGGELKLSPVDKTTKSTNSGHALNGLIKHLNDSDQTEGIDSSKTSLREDHDRPKRLSSISDQSSYHVSNGQDRPTQVPSSSAKVSSTNRSNALGCYYFHLTPQGCSKPADLCKYAHEPTWYIAPRTPGERPIPAKLTPETDISSTKTPIIDTIWRGQTEHIRPEITAYVISTIVAFLQRRGYPYEFKTTIGSGESGDYSLHYGPTDLAKGLRQKLKHALNGPNADAQTHHRAALALETILRPLVHANKKMFGDLPAESFLEH